MKTCIDCSEPVSGPQSIRCLSCKVIRRRVVQQVNKEKNQYHKKPIFRYATYKRGAIRRGYVFDLTFEEFNELWNKPCTYCADAIKGIGIDRIDNNVGYTAINVIPCCTTCNWMKHKLTQKDFISQCKKIVSVSLL